MKTEPIVGNSEFGTALCEALGLNDRVVRSIRLAVEVDEPVTVEVTQFVTVEQAPRLVEALSRYNLVPKDEKPPC